MILDVSQITKAANINLSKSRVMFDVDMFLSFDLLFYRTHIIPEMLANRKQLCLKTKLSSREPIQLVIQFHV